MKAIKILSKATTRLDRWRTNSKGINTNNYELTYTKFGFNLKAVATPNKATNSLLTQMYSDENEVLFI
jgi:predicted DNA-binding ArsR family transcriptional regulator